jgi:CHAT domain-containing protein
MLLTASFSFGQTLSTSKKAYLDHLETLFDEGRYSYVDIGNKAQLKRVIDAFEAAIKQGKADETITQKDEDSLLLQVKLDKLWGDYHYLNADQDASSFAQAEKYYRNALAFTEDKAHARHPDIFYYQFVMYQELGQLYYKQGHYKKAYDAMEDANMLSHLLKDDNEALNFNAQLAMCEARIGLFEDAIDNINEVIGYYKNKKTEPYGEALRKKAKILMLQQENDGTGMVDPTRDALKCYKEYFTLKKTDALKRLGSMSAEDREHYWMRTRPFAVDCYRLEDTDPAFLYDVTLFSKSLLLDYDPSGKPQNITWKQVQKKLQNNDCALEFIQYEKYGEKQMGALVLKKKGKPQFVRIGKLENIKNLTLAQGDLLYNAVKTDRPELKNELYSDSSLFQFIWTPELLTAIGKDTHRLYFAADGLFHELAIEYMLPKMPELTALKTENLYRLSSTRQLLVKNKIKRNGKILLCGDIDFYGKSNLVTDSNEAKFTNDVQAYMHLKSLELLFDNLPGTKIEIEGIRKAYDSTLVVLLTDTLATEQHAAHLIGQYPIVHLATHGYYLGSLPEGTDLMPASYDESLSLSGIAFAGSSSALKSNNFNASQHDGIFSAREISQMDFSGVDLIVLSACQTAQGFMTDDGIYGLQRSLKRAGIKGMILSLWSIDDEAAPILMQAFYKHLQTEDIHTAFIHAREDLLAVTHESERSFDPVRMKGVDNSTDFRLPYFNDAFILIDIK